MAVIIKTKEQIKKIRDANQIIARLYEEILPERISPGMTTMDLNNIIEEYIRSQGAIPATIGVKGIKNYYPAGSCISVNEEVIHGVPGDRILKEGDLVSVDTVTNLDGYFGDAATTIPVGKIDELSQKLIDVTKKCLKIGIKECYAGNRLGNLGNAIENYAKENEFSVVRDYCGHGVGLSMHEDPMVTNYGRKERGIYIKEGMVLAIEPMLNVGSYKVNVLKDGWTVVTKDRKRSAHFEHSVAIIDGKPVILSKLD